MKKVLYGASSKSLELYSPEVDFVIDANWNKYTCIKRVKLELHWRLVLKKPFCKVCFPISKLDKYDSSKTFIILGDIFRRDEAIVQLSKYGYKMNENLFEAFCLSEEYCALKHVNITKDERTKKDLENDWVKIREMSKYIPDNISSISDYGCGQQILKDYLPPVVNYIGIDYRDCGQENLINLDVDELPMIKAECIFCCGIIEFLTNWERFLNYIGQQGANTIIISYSPREFTNYNTFRSPVYHNCIYSFEIVAIIVKYGYELSVFSRFESRQAIYAFKKVNTICGLENVQQCF